MEDTGEIDGNMSSGGIGDVLVSADGRWVVTGISFVIHGNIDKINTCPFC